MNAQNASIESISNPQLKAMAPVLVQAIFYYGGDSVLLILEGEANFGRCVAFHSFPDAVAAALQLGLIPKESVNRVQNFPLGPESPAVAGGWTHCLKAAFRELQVCEARFYH